MQNLIRYQNLLIPILTFILGLVIGMLFFGSNSGATNAGPRNLVAEPHLDNYVRSLAAYAQVGDVIALGQAVCYPKDDYLAIKNRREQISADELRGLYDLVLATMQKHDSNDTSGGCDSFRLQHPPVIKEQNSWGLLLNLFGMLLLIGILGAVLWLLLNKQLNVGTKPQQVADETKDETRVMTRPQNSEVRDAIKGMPTAPAKAKQPQRQPAKRADVMLPNIKGRESGTLGGFQTIYNRGDDTFDKSFIIEDANGSFLGECGVSVSEWVGGTETGKNVTAFEIWLFDKHDPHTVTKVLMSDHAYHDNGFRAKLATRGDAVLVKYDETIRLETATLIVDTDVIESVYADIEPHNGAFERFSARLIARVKPNRYQDSNN